jgi:hypothetical protein
MEENPVNISLVINLNIPLKKAFNIESQVSVKND